MLRRLPGLRLRGGRLATVGYVLSPLSWWNDLVVNVPLAYAFAVLLSLVSRDLFLPAMVLGYWLTNVLGFVLLHTGAVDLLAGDPRPYTRWALLRDLVLSVGYTGVVVALAWLGILRPPPGL